MAHAQTFRPTVRIAENAAALYFVLALVEQHVSNTIRSAQVAQHAPQVLASVPTVDWLPATALAPT